MTMTSHDVARLGINVDSREGFDPNQCGCTAEVVCDECYYHSMNELEAANEELAEIEDDGQPSEYEEWQDFYDGDDWDHGQYDHDDW